MNAVNGEPETPDSPFEIDDLGVLKEYDGDEERVEIPSGVAELDEYSFSAKERVRTVVIPATVEYINTSAFLNCPALTDCSAIRRSTHCCLSHPPSAGGIRFQTVFGNSARASFTAVTG